MRTPATDTLCGMMQRGTLVISPLPRSDPMSDYLVKLDNIRFAYQLDPVLDDFSWQWPRGQHIAIVGGNGCGKTTLAQLLTDKLRANRGQRYFGTDICANDIAHISFDQHRELMEHDRRFDDSENRDDAFDVGTRVSDAILQGRQPDAAFDALSQRLGIAHILPRGIRFISTGESRKTLLARALLARPAALIIDNPLEGLDASAQIDIRQLLDELVASATPLLLLTNSASDIPEAIDEVQVMAEGKISQRCSAAQARQLFAPQPHFSKPLPIAQGQPWPDNTPLFTLKNVDVSFRGTPVLSDINWQLLPHQHCWISGPNGAGKSTLLGLLCGDNDKAYGQHVELFGKRRGSGESIWEIKQQFGLLNTSMQLKQLKRVKAIDVIASGFFDTIGLYDEPSPAQQQLLVQWLEALELMPMRHQRFERLSFGQQRMILLARALVKSPRILLLDEPCIGLDEQQRARLLGAVDQIAAQSHIRILFVSHRADEVPSCINQQLQLVPAAGGGYTAEVSQKPL